MMQGTTGCGTYSRRHFGLEANGGQMIARKSAATPALTWAQNLAGHHPHGAELDWLGPDGAQVTKSLGSGAVAWAIEVGEAIATKIGDQIPQLVQGASDFAILRRATTSTTLRSLAITANIGTSDVSLASAEVVEIAQDFARRGLELDDLLRSIRVGYAVLAGALLDAVIAADPHDTTELRRVSVLMFERMDDFTATAATAFLDEHRAANDHLTAARLDSVRTIVAGESVNTEQASRLLNYSLSAEHIAIIASTDRSGSSAYARPRIFVDRFISQLSGPIAKLIVPVGTQTLWVWLAYNAQPSLDSIATLPKVPGVNVAIGQPGRGVEGFRRSHHQARAVDRLRLACAQPRVGLIEHRNVELQTLLLADLDAGRDFALRQLGPLAGSDPRAVELRDTLQLYLTCDRSLNKVAEIKHISRNTVTYRVQQALELCGHKLGTSTAKLYAAILIVDWLDPAGSQ
jgi:DNA-binding PucR family transcriptional regulator